MILTPYNVANVTRAIESCLRADVRLANVAVERSAEVNADPARCPWVGIYRARIEYPSRTLGLGAGYRGQRMQLILLTQQSDGSSGEACEDAIEALNVDVLSVLLTDPTLGGVVSTLDEIDIQYPDYQRTSGGRFVQTAAIYITALGGITAT